MIKIVSHDAFPYHNQQQQRNPSENRNLAFKFGPEGLHLHSTHTLTRRAILIYTRWIKFEC